MILRREKIVNLLALHARQLVDSQITLMDRDIAEGWRAFYARPVWFKENLPPPLINEQGQRFLADALSHAILFPDEAECEAYSTAYRRMVSKPEHLHGYRNYLYTGTLDIERVTPENVPLDEVANTITKEIVEHRHCHMSYEVRRNREDWILEASQSAEYTPPYIYVQKEISPAVRDVGIALIEDKAYWSALYNTSEDIAWDPKVFSSPAWFAKLMAALGPDFPFSEAMSMGKRLVFSNSGENRWAWALLVEKRNSPHFSFPPVLALIPSGLNRKLRDSDILYRHVPLTYTAPLMYGARSIETQLRFFLPHFRRLIGFYHPNVGEALGRA